MTASEDLLELQTKSGVLAFKVGEQEERLQALEARCQALQEENRILKNRCQVKEARWQKAMGDYRVLAATGETPPTEVNRVMAVFTFTRPLPVLAAGGICAKDCKHNTEVFNREFCGRLPIGQDTVMRKDLAEGMDPIQAAIEGIRRNLAPVLYDYIPGVIF